MTNTNEKLLEFIRQGSNLNELAAALNLSKKQIFNRLNSIKYEGYNIGVDVLDTGSLSYHIINDTFLKSSHSAKLKLSKNSMRLMIISDLHIGSALDNIDRLNLIYEYCANNDIHIIINCGDLIDGTIGGEKRIKDVNEQIEEVISKHPFDNNIMNFVCFGNHDYSTLYAGIDIEKILLKNRQDFMPLGYGYGLINVGNTQIILNHYIKAVPINLERQEIYNGKIVLAGHKHRMKTSSSRYKLCINVPTLSDIIFPEKPSLPGAIDMNVTFNEARQFECAKFSHLIVTDKIYLASFYVYNFSQKALIYEEDVYGKNKKKILTI